VTSEEKTPGEQHSEFTSSPESTKDRLFILLFCLLQRSVLSWIVIAIVSVPVTIAAIRCPKEDLKEIVMAFLRLNDSHYLCVIVMLMLSFVIILMGVIWRFTSREEKRELDRVVEQRDELQAVLGCHIQSSEK